MIQKEELMIGNWVLDGDNYHQWTCYDYTLNPEFYHPIPLTSELLIKCGFKFINNQNNFGWILGVGNRQLCWCHSDFVSLEFKEGQYDDFNDTIFDFPIKYLHQLQNIYYSLTNKQLIITL